MFEGRNPLAKHGLWRSLWGHDCLGVLFRAGVDRLVAHTRSTLHLAVVTHHRHAVFVFGAAAAAKGSARGGDGAEMSQAQRRDFHQAVGLAGEATEWRAQGSVLMSTHSTRVASAVFVDVPQQPLRLAIVDERGATDIWELTPTPSPDDPPQWRFLTTFPLLSPAPAGGSGAAGTERVVCAAFDAPSLRLLCVSVDAVEDAAGGAASGTWLARHRVVKFTSRTPQQHAGEQVSIALGVLCTVVVQDAPTLTPSTQHCLSRAPGDGEWWLTASHVRSRAGAGREEVGKRSVGRAEGSGKAVQGDRSVVFLLSLNEGVCARAVSTHSEASGAGGHKDNDGERVGDGQGEVRGNNGGACVVALATHPHTRELLAISKAGDVCVLDCRVGRERPHAVHHRKGGACAEGHGRVRTTSHVVCRLRPFPPSVAGGGGDGDGGGGGVGGRLEGVNGAADEALVQGTGCCVQGGDSLAVFSRACSHIFLHSLVTGQRLAAMSVPPPLALASVVRLTAPACSSPSPLPLATILGLSSTPTSNSACGLDVVGMGVVVGPVARVCQLEGLPRMAVASAVQARAGEQRQEGGARRGAGEGVWEAAVVAAHGGEAGRADAVARLLAALRQQWQSPPHHNADCNGRNGRNGHSENNNSHHGTPSGTAGCERGTGGQGWEGDGIESVERRVRAAWAVRAHAATAALPLAALRLPQDAAALSFLLRNEPDAPSHEKLTPALRSLKALLLPRDRQGSREHSNGNGDGGNSNGNKPSARAPSNLRSLLASLRAVAHPRNHADGPALSPLSLSSMPPSHPLTQLLAELDVDGVSALLAQDPLSPDALALHRLASSLPTGAPRPPDKLPSALVVVLAAAALHVPHHVPTLVAKVQAVPGVARDAPLPHAALPFVLCHQSSGLDALHARHARANADANAARPGHASQSDHHGKVASRRVEARAQLLVRTGSAATALELLVAHGLFDAALALLVDVAPNPGPAPAGHADNRSAASLWLTVLAAVCEASVLPCGMVPNALPPARVRSFVGRLRACAPPDLDALDVVGAITEGLERGLARHSDGNVGALVLPGTDQVCFGDFRPLLAHVVNAEP